MKKFFDNGKLFTGINYWESKNAINMWENFDERIIEEDFEKLSKAGVTILRVFPIWTVFQPIKAMRDNFGVIEYRLGEEPFPDTDAGRAGVSEEACEKFEVMCRIAEKFNLKLIVGLITGHMSGRYYAPPAFSDKNPISDPTLVKWEIRFIKYFVTRMKKYPAIAGWDLGNECCGFTPYNGFENSDTSYVWQTVIANTIRLADPDHPVISGYDSVPIASGAFNAAELGESLDINTTHPYTFCPWFKDPLISMRPILEGPFKCRLYSDIANIPTFIQEVGSIGYTTCSRESEADFYRCLLYAAWAHDCLGVMWWCAFDQDDIEYAPYDFNNIGSEYGFFDKCGNAKPIVNENIKFNETVNKLPFKELPPAITDAVCIIPKICGDEYVNTLRSAYCLAKQAGIDLKFAHADSPLPESDIYLMPSIDTTRAITRHRFVELLERVKEGATLYLSIGSAQFRWFDKLSGMDIAYREGSDVSETIFINDTKLTVKPDFKYIPENVSSKIIAKSDDGRAVYVRNNYGKGYIYASTMPVEKFLGKQNCVFNSESAQNFSQWYKCLKNEKNDKRVLNITADMVCATEHIIDDTSRYAVIINYSKVDITTEISVKSDWKITHVYKGKTEKNKITVPACDAMILELGKTAE
ncbi:MAG: hypothetical protein SPF92_03790 [Clostridia bacterium]|nr:hypothetical protein [Oscillospiraceae bacterium]MDY5626712.1 hypothetical protein [Clostridia bacterium]